MLGELVAPRLQRLLFGLRQAPHFGVARTIGNHGVEIGDVGDRAAIGLDGVDDGRKLGDSRDSLT